MNWNLQKITSIKNTLSKYLTFCAFILCLVSLSILYLAYINFRASNEKIKLLNTKKNASIHLLSASLRINQNQMDSRTFIQEHLEKITLLSDLKHRHDQALHPSWPISFNPNENVLKHEYSLIKSRPFTHISAKLIKKTLMDEEDLKQLFCLVEQKNIFPYTACEKAPYLYFSYFELKKQTLKAFEKVYEVNYVLEAFHK